MKSKEEFLRGIKSEVESYLYDIEFDAIILDASGNEAKIAYSYDESATADNKLYENHLTNFAAWRNCEEWAEYEIDENEVISFLESELNIYFLCAINQFGDRVWVDVVFDENYDESARNYIEGHCRLSYDYEDLQNEINELV